MLLAGFLYQFAMVSLILGVLAIIRYAYPGSIPGRISTALVG